MKRGFVVVIGGTAIAAAALSGCSHDKDKDKSSSTVSSAASTPAPMGAPAHTGAPAPGGVGGTAKVTIDGKQQKVTDGTVACTSTNGILTIGIGSGDTAFAATLNDSVNPPTVTSVGLGSYDGAELAYAEGSPSDSAIKATKNGETYDISGTVSGTDSKNQTVTKPFEITVTCP